MVKLADLVSGMTDGEDGGLDDISQVELGLEENVGHTAPPKRFGELLTSS